MPNVGQPFGQYLINTHMPEGYKFDGEISGKDLKSNLTRLSRNDPQTYAKIVGNVKKLGDHFATTEGLSVGLDDLEPNYKARDLLLNPVATKMHKAKTDNERRKLLEDLHPEIKNLAMRHPGSMTAQVTSGARGSPNAYTKIVATPVYARDGRGRVEPWLIRKSYSEGMTPADNWVISSEAILDTIKSYTSVSEPGELSKILVNNMNNILITEQDCGTHNGILMNPKDSDVIDRYLARDVGPFRRNTLITPTVQPSLAKASAGKILVRSPMTCEAGDGVCQHCQGLNEKGRMHDIGTNIGVRSAQAMAEPLTQLALSAKHGAGTIASDRMQLTGLEGFRQAIESPNLFLNKATLSSVNGAVSKINKAPQGGHFVHVGDTSHYVSPNLGLKVKMGDTVEKGDALGHGIPKPDEIVKYKGLGAGRVYMVNTLRDIYKNQGINLDQRHFELLALGELNHVRILDDPGNNFFKGDVVNYNNLKSVLSQGIKQVALSQSLGETLGKEYFHFSVGMRVSASMIDFLRSHGIKEVFVAPRAPKVEFVMKPATRAPLYNPDWMARLAHRNLKSTLQQAAHFGEISNIHGTSPVPAYVLGTEFGKGERGKY